ncbi:ABC transporter permease [soil metagenome]
MLGAVAADVRFALRQIRRAPGFAASAILTLALGVGANTGIFSLLNGYLRPLPVLNADQLVVVAAEVPGDETGFRYRFSYQAVQDYRRQGDVFSDVFAFDTYIGGLTAGGHSTQFLYHPVTGNFFTGLRLAPLLGRVFTPGEGESAGGEPTVVLGYAFWQKRFGGDPNIVGSAIRIDGRPAQVVGVLPAGFHGLYQGAEIEGYVTLDAVRQRSAQPDRFFADRAVRYLTMVARMKPGVTFAEAQSAVNVISSRLQATYPAERNVGARVVPEILARPIPLRFLSTLMPLIRGSMLGLASLVLLIACMNVANLLMVRATARQREMAVRAALGAGRKRLIRLLLAESLILSAAGTLLGLLFARWATDLFLGSIKVSIEMPLNLDFHYDWRVFAYASGIAMVTGVVMGVAPALRASRVRVTGLLHDGGYGSAGAGRQRLRSALVVAQVAGSLVLLVVAGLLVRSLQRAQTVDLGFDPQNVLVARVDPRQIGYTQERAITFYDELERKLRALPSVDSVAMSFSVPMGYIFDACQVQREGDVVDADAPKSAVGCNPVSSDYLETLKIPVLHGRGFNEYDAPGSEPVVVVNETLARQLWPNGDAIGKQLRIPRFVGSHWQVVGVARDSKYIAVFEEPLPHVYFPLKQMHSFMRVIYLRSNVSPGVLGPQVQRAVQSLDPDVPVADVMTLRQSLEGGSGFLLFRIGAVQAAAMGILGLLLAVVGVYGVVSYGATQRTRELGIRLALGAAPANVGALILRQGSTLVAAGIIAGLIITAGVTRLLARFFVLVSATDGRTFGSVTGVLFVIALVACYLPARRAMKVDPMVALRHE